MADIGIIDPQVRDRVFELRPDHADHVPILTADTGTKMKVFCNCGDHYWVTWEEVGWCVCGRDIEMSPCGPCPRRKK